MTRLIIAFTVSLFTVGFSYGQPNASLKKQARQLVARLKKDFSYPVGGKDTLIDLNGDHYKDVLIEFYGLAGTGEKNAVSVYLYDRSKKRFVHVEQLDNLANPTFYPAKKIVAGYYVGNGGGGATKLRWKGMQLDTLEHIDIDVTRQQNQLSFKLVSLNYITKKRTSATLASMRLPRVYNYGHYKPVITGNSD